MEKLNYLKQKRWGTELRSSRKLSPQNHSKPVWLKCKDVFSLERPRAQMYSHANSCACRMSVSNRKHAVDTPSRTGQIVVPYRVPQLAGQLSAIRRPPTASKSILVQIGKLSRLQSPAQFRQWPSDSAHSDRDPLRPNGWFGLTEAEFLIHHGP